MCSWLKSFEGENQGKAHSQLMGKHRSKGDNHGDNLNFKLFSEKGKLALSKQVKAYGLTD